MNRAQNRFSLQDFQVLDIPLNVDRSNGAELIVEGGSIFVARADYPAVLSFDRQPPLIGIPVQEGQSFNTPFQSVSIRHPLVRTLNNFETPRIRLIIGKGNSIFDGGQFAPTSRLISSHRVIASSATQTQIAIQVPAGARRISRLDYSFPATTVTDVSLRFAIGVAGNFCSPYNTQSYTDPASGLVFTYNSPAALSVFLPSSVVATGRSGVSISNVVLPPECGELDLLVNGTGIALGALYASFEG